MHDLRFDEFVGNAFTHGLLDGFCGVRIFERVSSFCWRCAMLRYANTLPNSAEKFDFSTSKFQFMNQSDCCDFWLD